MSPRAQNIDLNILVSPSGYHFNLEAQSDLITYMSYSQINNIPSSHTFKGFKFSSRSLPVFVGKGTINYLVTVGVILLTIFGVILQEYRMNPIYNHLLDCTLIATTIYIKVNKPIQGTFHQVSNGWIFMVKTHLIQSSISPFT